MKRLVCLFAAAGALFGALALPAFAQSNVTWTYGGYYRNFEVYENWSPTWYWTSDRLRIDDASDTTSPILAMDLSYYPISQLYIGSLSSGDPGIEFTPATTTGGKLTIEEYGHLAVNGKIDVGVIGPIAGENTLKLTGGYIVEGGSTTGGTLTQSAGETRVGVLYNKGTLDMSGAARFNHTAGSYIVVGGLDGGEGIMNMTDDTVLNIAGTTLYVGTMDGGPGTCTGTLNMSGKAYIGVDVGNALRVGRNVGATGSVKMSGNANIGWFAGTMHFGELGGTGTLEMTENAFIYQNAYEANYGIDAGSQGHLIMTGSSTTAGVRPYIQQRGPTYIGRNGGTGTATVTDALYWAESNSVLVGDHGGNGTFTLETTAGSANTATLDVAGHLYAAYEGGTGVIDIKGESVVNVANWIVAGHWDGGTTPTANGTINVYGGTVTKANVAGTFVGLGFGGTGTWNQFGGTSTINSATKLGNHNDVTGGNTGILNLNGGIYATNRIYTGDNGTGNAKGRINFDGGTLQVNPNGPYFFEGDTFLETRNAPDMVVTVKAGGAVLDTNGHNVIVPIGFTGDSLSTGGGLSKIGGGTLALYGQSSYTGPTTVTNGTVQLLSKLTTQAISTAPGLEGERKDGTYSLGRKFTVNAGKSIQVTQLGVFDSLGDGLNVGHVVHLTNTATLADTTVTLDAGTSGTYSNGFRFLDLPTPLALDAGEYMVWVDGMGNGNDDFSQFYSSRNEGNTGAITFGWGFFGVVPGSMPNNQWTDGPANADASFVFYDPSSVIAANMLPTTTPVVLGGAIDTAPTLDLNGVHQQIGSLADLAGAAVLGTVTNSMPDVPVVLTLGAASGSTTYSGSIAGNISLVKDGGGTQSLLGSLNYVGDTTVNAGELFVTNLNTPANTVSVQGSGILTAGSIVADTLAIGGTPAASAAVPEPGAFALLAFAALGMLIAWRRK